MCEYSYSSEKGKDLSFEEFTYIIGFFPHLRAVDMTGIGEPFLNNDFAKMLSYLKSKLIFVTFNDNFTILTPKIAEKLIQMQVDEIVISLDGATRETYEKIRVGANFERVMTNIRNLIRLKKEMNSELPKLGIIFVVSNENLRDAPLMVNLAESLNCWLKLVKVKTFKETKDLSIDINDPETSAILKQVRKKALEKNVRVIFRHFEKKSLGECDFPWKTCYITYDGFVYPCSYVTHSGGRNYLVNHSLGNVFQEDFGKIWISEKMKTFRDAVRRGKAPILCSTCRVFGSDEGRN